MKIRMILLTAALALAVCTLTACGKGEENSAATIQSTSQSHRDTPAMKTDRKQRGDNTEHVAVRFTVREFLGRKVR